MIVLALAILYLAFATFVTGHRVTLDTFIVIYSSGLPLGAGIAIVVASYRVTREIAGN